MLTIKGFVHFLQSFVAHFESMWTELMRASFGCADEHLQLALGYGMLALVVILIMTSVICGLWFPEKSVVRLHLQTCILAMTSVTGHLR